jgi:hypothetical protein
MAEHGFTNIQIKHADVEAVRKAMDHCVIEQSKLFARANVDWIAMYPSATEDGDSELLKEYCQCLSKTLDATVLGVLVSSDSTMLYAIFEHGEMLDEYEPGSQILPQHIDSFLSICPATVKRKEVQALFASHEEGTISSPTFVHAVGHFLDIPRAQIGMGFSHLKEARL